MTPNDKLVKKVKIMQGTGLVNKLMRIADREIALSMLYMAECDRQLIYNNLSLEKVKRVREELRLIERLQISYTQYRMAIDHVTKTLGSEKKGNSLKSYLRPRRPRR